ncbi:hypothetical protein H2198_008032 [Neophaeococcomyces mojaviensis]|uniref:Uncharacterized protein n=1 Tax=Neophaeococcomyces mojaviensis TaxID=3383035 RepID=A0ACC2ZYF6_9EURO|nr:hypothetical protein H2198_008032 [Knufia sp. JES_112]
MAEVPETARIRRRVRTGCWACRRRRRKCDEGKPVCENCKTKNLPCQYGPKYTFVEPKQPLDEAENIIPSHTLGKFRFVVEPQAPNANDLVGNTADVSPYDIRECGTTNEEDLSQVNAPITLEVRSGSDLPTFDGQKCTPDVTSEVFSAHSRTRTNSCPTEAGGDRGDGQDDLQQGAAKQWVVTRPEFWPHVTSTVTLTHLGGELDTDLHSDVSIIEQEQYELELFRHYRYQIAPVLDLGVGTLYYGVQVLLKTKISSEIHNAVLALARSHRANRNPTSCHFHEPISGSNSTRIENDAAPNFEEDNLTVKILMLWRNTLTYPPQSWFQIVCDTDFGGRDNFMLIEHQLLLFRLVLAARLLAPSVLGSSGTHPWCHQGLLQLHVNAGLDLPRAKLQHSLTLLEQSLDFIAGSSKNSALMDMPPVPAWQACWRKVQMWFATRNEEMEEIFGPPYSSPLQIQTDDNSGFPVIVFGSACATVANVVHHLTAMLLLQNKPRLAKASADHIPFISLTWQIQRIVGIIATASESELGDPIVISALIHAARKLSHSKQLSVVADVLEKAATASGMQLGGEIQKLKQCFGYSRSNTIIN